DTQPSTQFVSMDALVDTVAAGARPEVRVDPLGPRRFAVRGKLPAGHRRLVKIYEIEEPASFARALLIEALRRRGVRVAASPLAENRTDGLPSPGELAKLPQVATYTSPPFGEFVRVILKVSHNLHASTLPLLLAARQGKPTLAAGLRRQGEILKSLGLKPG